MNGTIVHLEDVTPSLDALGGYTADQLQAREFPPLGWAIPGIVPEGLTVLGAKPKQGKSWLALAWTLAVASGGVALGSIKTGPPRDALYVALEDSERRMQGRLSAITETAEIAWPRRLHLFHRWPRLDLGGVEALDEWAMGRDPGLIVIDTWQRVRPPARGRNTYAEDYEDLVPLHDWATTMRVATVLVHHHRKSDGDDWVDSLSGSTGLTGAVDTIVSLFRERGRHDATLRVVGRDIDDEPEIALGFSDGLWTLLGDAAVYRLERTRALILEIVGDLSEATPQEITDLIDGVSYPNVKQTLRRMLQDGQVLSPRRGVYALPKLSLQSPSHHESDVVTEVTGLDTDPLP